MTLTYPSPRKQADEIKGEEKDTAPSASLLRAESAPPIDGPEFSGPKRRDRGDSLVESSRVEAWRVGPSVENLEAWRLAAAYVGPRSLSGSIQALSRSETPLYEPLCSHRIHHFYT